MYRECFPRDWDTLFLFPETPATFLNFFFFCCSLAGIQHLLGLAASITGQPQRRRGDQLEVVLLLMVEYQAALRDVFPI